jgi:hypothetical protein
VTAFSLYGVPPICSTSRPRAHRHDVIQNSDSDPRITTETYGHLQPDYLRSEIDRLRFNTEPANDPSSGSQPSAALSQKLLTTFSQGP